MVLEMKYVLCRAQRQPDADNELIFIVPHRIKARVHGARGGAPKGKANGAYRHGILTAEAIEERRALRSLVRKSWELMAMLEGE
jgi:hypothetical protein